VSPQYCYFEVALQLYAVCYAHRVKLSLFAVDTFKAH